MTKTGLPAATAAILLFPKLELSILFTVMKTETELRGKCRWEVCHKLKKAFSGELKAFFGYLGKIYIP